MGAVDRTGRTSPDGAKSRKDHPGHRYAPRPAPPWQSSRHRANRKNRLFVGNERGGGTAAILSSLTGTCRRHAIDPQRYLTQLLINLPATPVSQLDRWLPDEWKRRDSPKPPTA